jgi:hypothetical protein
MEKLRSKSADVLDRKKMMSEENNKSPWRMKN